MTLVPEKLKNPFGMQIMFDHDGHTRSIYVYADNGKDLVDWYTCLRAAKLSRYQLAYPAASVEEVREMIKQKRNG